MLLRSLYFVSAPLHPSTTPSTLILFHDAAQPIKQSKVQSSKSRVHRVDRVINLFWRIEQAQLILLPYLSSLQVICAYDLKSWNNMEAAVVPPSPSLSPFPPASINVEGTVVYCVSISPSMSFFTISKCEPTNPCNTKSTLLDVLVARKRPTPSQSAHVREIMAEAERCRVSGEPIVVHGDTWEQCGCRSECDAAILHCSNVNQLILPTEEDMPILCQEIEPTQQLSAISLVSKKGSTIEGTVLSKTKRKRVDVKNRSRAARFVETIIEQMGVDKLKASQVGVLDVAGGAGGVTFELSLRREINCTVIDPRQVKLNKTQRNTLKFRARSRDLLREGLHISHFATVLYERFKEWHPSQMQTLFDEDFASSKEGDAMLRNCVAIVGMHPDEATDVIIEMGMRYNKPWFVVPCCIFPNTFKRTLPNGKFVRQYDELCEYIKAISPDVQEVILDFEGRNKCYFWMGDNS